MKQSILSVATTEYHLPGLQHDTSSNITNAIFSSWENESKRQSFHSGHSNQR